MNMTKWRLIRAIIYLDYLFITDQKSKKKDQKIIGVLFVFHDVRSFTTESVNKIPR